MDSYTPEQLRAIDEAVAIHVMNRKLPDEYGIRYKDGRVSWKQSPAYTIQKCENYQRQGLGCELVKRKDLGGFSPTTSFEAMSEVIEKMRNDGFSLVLCHELTNATKEKITTGRFFKPGMDTKSTTAKTMPLFVALAALKSKGVEV